MSKASPLFVSISHFLPVLALTPLAENKGRPVGETPEIELAGFPPLLLRMVAAAAAPATTAVATAAFLATLSAAAFRPSLRTALALFSVAFAS